MARQEEARKNENTALCVVHFDVLEGGGRENCETLRELSTIVCSSHQSSLYSSHHCIVAVLEASNFPLFETSQTRR